MKKFAINFEHLFDCVNFSKKLNILKYFLLIREFKIRYIDVFRNHL